MNTWLEKLALTLFLLLGMGFYNASHADSSLPEEMIECPISGQVSLRVNGTIDNGRLDGFINNQFVTWTVMNRNVTGFVNGHYINLQISPERNEYLLTGWISTNYIRWTSFGQQFREWVYCH